MLCRRVESTGGEGVDVDTLREPEPKPKPKQSIFSPVSEANEPRTRPGSTAFDHDQVGSDLQNNGDDETQESRARHAHAHGLRLSWGHVSRKVVKIKEAVVPDQQSPTKRSASGRCDWQVLPARGQRQCRQSRSFGGRSSGLSLPRACHLVSTTVPPLPATAR